MDILLEIKDKLKEFSNPDKVEIHKRFIQVVEGGYGYGDIVWGISIPNQRIVAKMYSKELELPQVESLLRDEVHELRLTALLILVDKYKKAKDIEIKRTIVNLYLNNTNKINNWDLVDLSADKIVGAYFYEIGKTDILNSMAMMGTLWEQRIAVVSTLYYIRKGVFEPTFKLCKLLIDHPHHLIHKALGWMLREIGKKDYDVLFEYLRKYYRIMPRITLRYAIERYTPEIRDKFLKGVI